MDIQEFRKRNTIAIRYEKIDDDGVYWDTDYIMKFDEMKMAINLDRSYSADALNTNHQFTTPYYIMRLIDAGYLEDDHLLPISANPYDIDENTIDLIDDVFDGKINYWLPVVYVPKTNNNEYPVDVKKLAYVMKGAAHVFAQQDKNVRTNDNTSEAKSFIDEFNGSIDIFFPNHTCENLLFPYDQEEGNDEELTYNVIDKVVRYLNDQKIDPKYTYLGFLQGLTDDRRISQKQKRMTAEEARKQAETEKNIAHSEKVKAVEDAEEFLAISESYNNDIESKKKYIAELERNLKNKESEIEYYRSAFNSQEEKPLLFYGKENQLYEGEIKDLVLVTCQQYIEENEPETGNYRRVDVLKDIVEQNNYEGIGKKKVEELSKIMKKINNMTPQKKQAIEALGIKLEKGGKHYKGTLYGDSRYTTTFSCTPSDNRGKLNKVSEVEKQMF